MNVDVFLSHRAEHSEVADLLTNLLKEALGPNLTVFASSDRRSLRGGDGWFEKIESSAREAAVVLVLLSPESAVTPWLYFEAGLGRGAEHRVIPVLFRGLTPEALGAPLNLLQVRFIEQERDVREMLVDVAVALRLQAPQGEEMVLESKFVQQLLGVQAKLPQLLVAVRPYSVSKEDRAEIHFQLVVEGTKDVEPLEAWASVPRRVLAENWMPPEAPPALTVKVSHEGEERVCTLRLRSDQPGPVPGSAWFRPDFEPLPKVVTPHMSPYELRELRLPLRQLEEHELGTVVRFGLNAKSNVHHTDEETLWDIVLRSRPPGAAA